MKLLSPNNFKALPFPITIGKLLQEATITFRKFRIFRHFQHFPHFQHFNIWITFCVLSVLFCRKKCRNYSTGLFNYFSNIGVIFEIYLRLFAKYLHKLITGVQIGREPGINRINYFYLSIWVYCARWLWIDKMWKLWVQILCIKWGINVSW